MDNNNPVPGTSAVPPQPMPNLQPVPSSEEPSKESKKPILWLVIGLVVVVVLVGGIYLFLSRQQAENQKAQNVAIQTPSPAPQENLEDELNSINVDTESDSDFTSIDQDLSQL